VVDWVEAGVVTVEGVKERKHVHTVKVGKRTGEEFFDLTEVAAYALCIDQDACAGHVFLMNSIVVLLGLFFRSL